MDKANNDKNNVGYYTILDLEKLASEIYNKEFDIQNFIFEIDKKLIKKSKLLWEASSEFS